MNGGGVTCVSGWAGLCGIPSFPPLPLCVTCVAWGCSVMAERVRCTPEGPGPDPMGVACFTAGSPAGFPNSPRRSEGGGALHRSSLAHVNGALFAIEG